MNIVQRSKWKARPPAHPLQALPTSGLRGVAIHHTGEAGPRDHKDCAAQVRGFQAFHIDTRGWSDIAYNFLVCPHGYVYVGRGWERRSAGQGTDAGNDGYHALCVMADGRKRFTRKQANALGALVRIAQERYPRAREVRPHSYFHSTACPGSLVARWIAGRKWRDDSARWKWAVWVATRPRDRGPQPPHPSPIPRSWWAAVRWLHRHRKKASK